VGVEVGGTGVGVGVMVGVGVKVGVGVRVGVGVGEGNRAKDPFTSPLLFCRIPKSRSIKIKKGSDAFFRNSLFVTVFFKCSNMPLIVPFLFFYPPP
jgi:hypothetical protein